MLSTLTTRGVAALILTATLSLAATGCGSDSSPKDSSPHGTLTVFAAASLTGTFTELGKEFEKARPGVKVAFSFGGSADLVSQITNGAPADVFASADVKNMDKLGQAHLEGAAPTDFASNTLEIATPPDNPAHISSLKSLTGKGVALVICAPEVPCGSAAAKVEAAAGLRFKPVSEEQSVTDVLAKVTAGEADAGLVYVTDVRAAGSSVHGVTFPESAAAVNVYPITTIKGSQQSQLAKAFVDFVLSTEGQGVLARAGFAKP